MSRVPLSDRILTEVLGSTTFLVSCSLNVYCSLSSFSYSIIFLLTSSSVIFISLENETICCSPIMITLPSMTAKDRTFAPFLTETFFNWIFIRKNYCGLLTHQIYFSKCNLIMFVWNTMQHFLLIPLAPESTKKRSIC